MPGPVIYVAAAIGIIGTVAAVLAFKEYVYDPHIAPQVQAVSQSISERNRQRARRRSPVSVPVSENERDENAARRNSARQRPRPNDRNDRRDSSTIELESISSRGSGEQRNGVLGQSELRQRRAPGPIEDSNPHIPYPPLSPSRSTTASTSGPSRQVHSPPPPPRVVSPEQRAQPPVIHSPSPRVTGTPEMRYSSPRPTPPVLLSPRLPTPISNRSVTSSRATSPVGAHTERSTSSMSSFTPAVIGPDSPNSTFASPRLTSADTLSDAGRSNLDVLSVPTSRVNSPFSDIHAIHPGSANQSTIRSAGTSPLILSPGSAISDFEMPDSDFGMLSPSLRSGMFSPSLIHEEDPFEVGSNHESDDLSSWASVGRRTPEP